MRAWRFGLAALAVLSGFNLDEARAADYKTVACEGFAIKYDGASTKETCYEGDLSPGKAEELVAYSPTFLLQVAYLDAGFRHYFTAQPLDKLVKQSETISSPGPLYGGPAVGGYAVAVFVADIGTTKVHGVCLVFAKYNGEPEKTGEVGRF
jgi:hypothetical protein